NINDSKALHRVYDAFIPIMIELTRISGNTLGDICVSTTGQMVEFLLMRYAYRFGEIIPNKPGDKEIAERERNPIEGAYVKTPEPGIYKDIAVFDFRSLYPSIIISHNIDPSAICTDCNDYYESPIGVRFSKKIGITPMILKVMMDARYEVKKR
ncbi:DNA-directed DNA polymerase, family B, conserved region domain protein, partial [mine drainage metagenome]